MGGGSKDNMRQTMKELLGLVGLSPEDAEEGGAAPGRLEQIRPVSAAKSPVWEDPGQETSAEPADLEETQRKVASTVERGFFGFGRGKADREKERQQTEPAVGEAYAPSAEKPVCREPAFDQPRAAEGPDPFAEEEPIHPPFIRPDATVVAAGATFFGDIRAEGDVEVLGRLKGNLEATGNIRIAGKVLGDVKGDAVVLDSGVVQGNITSTSCVALDEGAMVVGDVLATDIDARGKVKGNLQIARAASFSATALLAGNVIAATIMMAQGAKLQGAVRISEETETSGLFGELEI